MMKRKNIFLKYKIDGVKMDEYVLLLEGYVVCTCVCVFVYNVFILILLNEFSSIVFSYPVSFHICIYFLRTISILYLFVLSYSRDTSSIPIHLPTTNLPKKVHICSLFALIIIHFLSIYFMNNIK